MLKVELKKFLFILFIKIQTYEYIQRKYKNPKITQPLTVLSSGKLKCYH